MDVFVGLIEFGLELNYCPRYPKLDKSLLTSVMTFFQTSKSLASGARLDVHPPGIGPQRPKLRRNWTGLELVQPMQSPWSHGDCRSLSGAVIRACEGSTLISRNMSSNGHE